MRIVAVVDLKNSEYFVASNVMHTSIHRVFVIGKRRVQVTTAINSEKEATGWFWIPIRESPSVSSNVDPRVFVRRASPCRILVF
jgi:hypothetical protein